MELKNRKNFIRHVAEMINSNHDKDTENESYIFGISGKWGEGKTTFLKDLAKELEGKGFKKPIEINPWKFATDKISFLRYFIKSFSIYYSPDKKEKIKNWLLDRNFLEDFYFDKSKNKIHWGWLFSIFIMLAVLTVVFVFLPQSISDKILSIKWILTILFIPIILGLAGKIISVQRSSKRISTLDEFEEKLNKIINSISLKKIIVFVDDLDRVTPGVARDTLDNLRTFFGNKKLSFVVTGDHTVLERYLGNELLPRSTSAEQIDEGRRFLKKIFNVYWRLPLPLKSELNDFINGEISKRETLNEIFKNGDLDVLKKYLGLYFEGNFRHIIRFLDTAIFSFKIIDDQINNADKDEGKYLKELKDKPLLVVRSLMIQDLCNPLFEEILKNSEILSNLEYAVQKKDTSNIDKILARFEDKLSIAQSVFIKKFLFEQPRFHNEYGPDVKSIKTFLYLAADASFGDARGPLQEDFKQYLKQGNPDEIKQSLLLSGEERLTEALEGFSQLNSEVTENKEKYNLFLTLINALVNMDSDALPQNKFLTGLQSIDIEFINQMPVNERVEFYHLYWQWLDKFDLNQTSQYKDKFTLTLDDINNLNFDNKIGPFTSLIIFNRLIEYYDENKADALNKMITIFEKLDIKTITNNFQELSKKLLNDFIADINNTDLSEKKLQLFEKYQQDAIQSLSNAVLENIKIKNQNVWNWAENNLDRLPFERKDIEIPIIKATEEDSDFNSLIETINFANNKISDLSDKFWKTILTKKKDILVDNIEQIANRQELLPLSPDNASARNIFEILYERAKNADQGDKIPYINLLNKDKWLWNQLSSMPKKRELKAMSRTKNQEVKNALDTIIASWS